MCWAACLFYEFEQLNFNALSTEYVTTYVFILQYFPKICIVIATFFEECIDTGIANTFEA